LDTLTHALSGALLARATAGKNVPARSVPRYIAAGFLACAAPDLDFVISLFGPEAYIAHHRGVTHSLILLPLWALGLSWVLAKLLREPAGWRALYGITAFAMVAHVAGDLITSYGTMILAPFSDWRAAIGTTFIIDLWFTGIIVLGLIASAALYRSKIPSCIALGALVAYVGFQYVQRENALDFAAAHAWSGAKIDAHPRPVSPFNWTVFVSDDERHELAHINLVRETPRSYQPGDGFVARIDSPYMPLDKAIWVTRTRHGAVDADKGREAWNSDAMRVFRWFAAEPAFDGVTEAGKCYWFVDLRFFTPGRDAMPFQFGACRDSPAGPWRSYERGARLPGISR
jgi:inner membrane protein